MLRFSKRANFSRVASNLIQKRYYSPCYECQSDATTEDIREFNRTYFIYKQLKEDCTDDWTSSYDEKASSIMVQQKSHYTKDICELRSLICEHVMAGIEVPDEIKDDVIDEIRKHQKHRQYDLERTLDGYQEKIDTIEELMQVREDLLEQFDKILDMQYIMDDLCITKLDDVRYEHDTFWSTDKYIRIDPDVSYIKDIAEPLIKD